MKRITRITLPIVTLLILLMLASVPASAAVRFHVYVGPRVYAYPTYPYAYPYAYDGYYYPYSNYYAAPAYPYYSYRWHRRAHERFEHRRHELHEHAYRR